MDVGSIEDSYGVPVAGPSAPAAPSIPPAATGRWQRGCELGLLIPGKRGNLDCTLCLDCVRACPEDNVVLATRLPGAELLDDGSGSGVGRRSRRWDLGLLASVFTFGALLNAFGMVSPVYTVQRELAAWLGTTSERRSPLFRRCTARIDSRIPATPWRAKNAAIGSR